MILAVNFLLGHDFFPRTGVHLLLRYRCLMCVLLTHPHNMLGDARMLNECALQSLYCRIVG